MTNWTHKLGAFLQVSPAAQLQPADLEQTTSKQRAAAGLSDALNSREQQIKHLARTADIPFELNGQTPLDCYNHPFVSENATQALGLPLDKLKQNHAQVTQACLAAQPEPSDYGNISDKQQAKFLSYWRLWRKNIESSLGKQQADELADFIKFLPAENALPDHSVWNHLSMCSAFASGDNADMALLKLQLGPVQDFIAAARNTMDLRSGSYLLSWLMAAGLKAVTAEVGPDSVIYPHLVNQPLYDLQWKEQLWDQVKFGERSAWSVISHKEEALRIPNLPNVCLLLVPAEQAEMLAETLQQGIRREWQQIAASVWQTLDAQQEANTKLLGDEGAFSYSLRKQRFEQQVANFLSIDWQITYFPQEVQDIAKLNNIDDKHPLNQAWQNFDAMLKQQQVAGQSDGSRFLAWGWVVALNGWQLDAVRKTRKFNGWNEGGWQIGTSSNKDALNGKEEAVAGGREWLKRCKIINSGITDKLKTADWMGASTLIKRVWHISYLRKLGVKLEEGLSKIEETIIKAQNKQLDDEGLYYAVIALDGDQMGARISGSNAPAWSLLLDKQAKSALRNQQARRVITPSYHAQFSEALSNFALQCVPQIIKQADGVLIYAGGDDVLAIVPVNEAISCSRELRKAFRGENGGFEYAGKKMLLPGPGCDVSVGMAIGSVRAPLQDLIRQAMQAEKYAKNKLERGALALSIIKRSGEITQWGCKWDSKGLDLSEKLIEALAKEQLSNRFSSRFCELLDCYTGAPLHMQLSGSAQLAEGQKQVLQAEELQQILSIETLTCLQRQCSISGREKAALIEDLEQLFSAYVKEICDKNAAHPQLCDEIVTTLSALLQSVAFLSRKNAD